MITITITFILWALVHSFLASLRVKSWVSALFGEGVQRWYRLFFVFFAGISLLPVGYFYITLHDQVLYQIGSPWRWIMMAGQGVSALALVIATWKSGLFQFVGISQVIA